MVRLGCWDSPGRRKLKLWAIHPKQSGMGAPTGMAPPRTVTQGWLGLFAISPIHYASNRAVATPQLLGKATTLGCQKLRVFRPCGVSRSYKIDTIAYIEGCLRGYCGLRTKVFDHRLHFLSAVEHNYFPCLRVRSGDSPISSRNAGSTAFNITYCLH